MIVKFNAQPRTDDELLMRCNVLPFQDVRTLFLLLAIAVLGTIQDGKSFHNPNLAGVKIAAAN